jgi:hypothetical protein
MEKGPWSWKNKGREIILPSIYKLPVQTWCSGVWYELMEDSVQAYVASSRYPTLSLFNMFPCL